MKNIVKYNIFKIHRGFPVNSQSVISLPPGHIYPTLGNLPPRSIFIPLK